MLYTSISVYKVNRLIFDKIAILAMYPTKGLYWVHAKLYFKGLVLAEGDNGAKLGAIGFAIFDGLNSVLYQESKPLVFNEEEEIAEELAQLEALVNGLHFALNLGIKTIVYSSVDFNVDCFVSFLSSLFPLILLFSHIIINCYYSYSFCPNSSGRRAF